MDVGEHGYVCGWVGECGCMGVCVWVDGWVCMYVCVGG